MHALRVQLVDIFLPFLTLELHKPAVSWLPLGNGIRLAGFNDDILEATRGLLA